MISKYFYGILSELSKAAMVKAKAKFINLGNDATEVDDIINKYDTLTAAGKIKGVDVFNIDYNELKDKINKAESEISKTQEKKETKLKNATKILDNDRFYIVSPSTYEASCLYGKGTKWCTAAIHTKAHWDGYMKQNVKFYYIVDKTKEPFDFDTKTGDLLYKVAIYVYPEGRIEAVNAESTNINAESYINSIGLDKNMFTPKEKTEEEKYLENFEKKTKDFLNNLKLTDEKAVKKDRDYNIAPIEMKDDGENLIFKIPIRVITGSRDTMFVTSTKAPKGEWGKLDLSRERGGSKVGRDPFIDIKSEIDDYLRGVNINFKDITFNINYVPYRIREIEFILTIPKDKVLEGMKK